MTEKKEKKTEKKAEVPKADPAPKPRARTADEEAAARAKAAAEEETAFGAAFADLLAAGLKGEALTAAAREKASGRLFPAATMAAVLRRIANPATDNWHASTEFGHVLKAAAGSSPTDQALLVFGVQQFCAEKSFPKIEVKGTQKRLIEILFNLLLKADLVDLEGFLAWADDTTERVYAGRTDAIVQTTGFVAQLRALLLEGDEEEDEDDEIDVQRPYKG